MLDLNLFKYLAREHNLRQFLVANTATLASSTVCQTVCEDISKDYKDYMKIRNLRISSLVSCLVGSGRCRIVSATT